MRDITVDGLVLRYLRVADDIDAVRALRGHIDLAQHSASLLVNFPELRADFTPSSQG